MNLPPRYGTQVYRFPSKGTSLKLEHCSSLKSLDPSGQSWILQDWYTLELPSHLSALRATSLKIEEIINHMEWVMHDHEKRTCHPYDIQVRIVNISEKLVPHGLCGILAWNCLNNICDTNAKQISSQHFHSLSNFQERLNFSPRLL